MLQDFFDQILQLIRGILVPIPVDNALGLLYVILNLILQVFGITVGDGGFELPF